MEKIKLLVGTATVEQDVTKIEVLKKKLKEFPTLLNDMENNTVRKYTPAGVCELSKKDKERIAELQKMSEAIGVKVICVLSSKIKWGKYTSDMSDYVLCEIDYDEDDVAYDGALEIFSACHNETLGINEVGIIGIVEKQGTVYRKW